MFGQIVLAAVVTLGLIALLAVCSWVANVIIAVGMLMEPYIGFPASLAVIFVALAAVVWAVMFKTI